MLSSITSTTVYFMYNYKVISYSCTKVTGNLYHRHKLLKVKLTWNNTEPEMTQQPFYTDVVSSVKGESEKLNAKGFQTRNHNHSN